MTKIKKPESQYLRSKSVKITAGVDFVSTVINAAVYLTIQTNDISKAAEQPSLVAMRLALMPAYRLIAESLGQHLKIPNMSSNDITGLSVDLRPCSGTWSFDVNYRQANGKIQPYAVKVSAHDSLNTFLRVRKAKGDEAAWTFINSI